MSKVFVCLLLYYGCIKISLNTSHLIIFPPSVNNRATQPMCCSIQQWTSPQECSSTTNLKVQNVFYCQVWLCHIVHYWSLLCMFPLHMYVCMSCYIVHWVRISFM